MPDLSHWKRNYDFLASVDFAEIEARILIGELTMPYRVADEYNLDPLDADLVTQLREEKGWVFDSAHTVSNQCEICGKQISTHALLREREEGELFLAVCISGDCGPALCHVENDLVLDTPGTSRQRFQNHVSSFLAIGNGLLLAGNETTQEQLKLIARARASRSPHAYVKSVLEQFDSRGELSDKQWVALSKYV